MLWPLALPAQPSTIEGHVSNAVTREPLAKASVVLARASGEPAQTTTTDSTGKFFIGGLEPGRYRLRVSRRGFVTLESRPVLDLTRARELTGIDLRLTPYGVLSGRILDGDGEPPAGAQVQLLRMRYLNGKRKLATTKVAFANDLGEYRWLDIEPGRYYIYAENWENTPAPVGEEGPVPVYYPGAAEPAGAAPIDVAAGAQVRVQDLALGKARTGSVKGRVVVELPGAESMPSVRFHRTTGHDNSAAGTYHTPAAKVNTAGEFEIHGLTPGLYIAGAQVAKGGRAYAGWTTVEVSGANVEGVVITVGAGLTLAGRIRAEDPARLDLKNARVKLWRTSSLADSLAVGWEERVAADRTFRIDGLDPARYGLLIAGLPDGFYLKSVRAGGTDVTYSGVDLASGSPGAIEILVGGKPGQVSGTVRNADKQPVPGAIVALVPADAQRPTIPEFYPEAAAGENGGFTFRNVPPGEYKVYAWEIIEPSAWMDPEFLRPFKDSAAPVTVGENAPASVQVSISQ